MEMIRPKDRDYLLYWYMVHNEPTREDVRKGKVSIPEGYNKRIIEGYLPLLKEDYKDIKKNIKAKEFVVGQAEVLPIYERETDNNNKTKVKIICSDFHIPFNDKELTELFLNYLSKIDVDEVILNGNINDCMAFSSHPRLRELAQTMKSAREERKSWFNFANALRLAVGNKTKIKYIGSQCHEGRIDKWVSLSPILVEDDNYTVEKWFKLADYGIDFIPEAYDPINEKDVSDGDYRGVDLIITHGTVCRSKSGISAMAEMEYNGVSTITAHTHRLSQVYKTTARGTDCAIECGCMCERKPWYYLKGKRRLLDWQQGFVILLVNPDGSYASQVLPISRDKDDKPFLAFNK